YGSGFVFIAPLRCWHQMVDKARESSVTNLEFRLDYHWLVFINNKLVTRLESVSNDSGRVGTLGISGSRACQFRCCILEATQMDDGWSSCCYRIWDLSVLGK